MAAFLPVYALAAPPPFADASPSGIALQGIFQGVLIGIASIFVYTRAVTALGAAETALFTAAVPCATTLAAVPLLSETPSATAMGGIVLVTAGMLIALRPGRKPAA